MHPTLFRLGAVNIPTFGVLVALGLVAAISLAARAARALRISEDAIWNLCLWTAAGTLVASRLFIVAKAPKAFIQFPLYLLTLPTVTNYGLIIAVACGAAYIAFRKLPWLPTLDALAPAALLLEASIHLGSLFAGDDLGSPTESWVGRLFKFDEGYHPVALYAAILSFAAAAIVYAWARRESQPGEALGLALALEGLTRFLADTFRPSYALSQDVMGILRADQWLLIAFVVVGVCFFFTRPRRA